MTDCGRAFSLLDFFCDLKLAHNRPAGKNDMMAVAMSTSMSLEIDNEMLRLIRRGQYDFGCVVLFLWRDMIQLNTKVVSRL